MTLRGPQSGIPPIIRKPPIAEDLDKLREKPFCALRYVNFTRISGIFTLKNAVQSGPLL